MWNFKRDCDNIMMPEAKDLNPHELAMGIIIGILPLIYIIKKSREYDSESRDYKYSTDRSI